MLKLSPRLERAFRLVLGLTLTFLALVTVLVAVSLTP